MSHIPLSSPTVTWQYPDPMITASVPDIPSDNVTRGNASIWQGIVRSPYTNRIPKPSSLNLPPSIRKYRLDHPVVYSSLSYFYNCQAGMFQHRSHILLGIDISCPYGMSLFGTKASGDYWQLAPHDTSEDNVYPSSTFLNVNASSDHGPLAPHDA